MFCSQCGHEVINKPCSYCGNGVLVEEYTDYREFSNKGIQALADAVTTLKNIFVNPSANLGSTYNNSSTQQLTVVSGIFLIISVLFTTAGINMILPNYMVFPSPVFHLAFLFALLVPLVFFSVTFAVEFIAHTNLNYKPILYLTSVYNFPIGIVLFLYGVFSIQNTEFLIGIGGFLVAYSAIVLYSGCIDILKFNEKSSIRLVPLIMLISFWITSALFRVIIL